MSRPETRRAPAKLESAAPDHQLPPGRGADVSGDTVSGPGVGTLLRSLGEDMGVLVRQEIELARVETTRSAKRLAKDSAWIGTGAAIAAVGGLCLVLALALGLGALLDSYWLGTLITGLLLVIVGALFAWKGARDLRKGELKPRRTVETVREDVDWARREVKEFKEELTKE